MGFKANAPGCCGCLCDDGYTVRVFVGYLNSADLVEPDPVSGVTVDVTDSKTAATIDSGTTDGKGFYETAPYSPNVAYDVDLTTGCALGPTNCSTEDFGSYAAISPPSCQGYHAYVYCAAKFEITVTDGITGDPITGDVNVGVSLGLHCSVSFSYDGVAGAFVGYFCSWQELPLDSKTDCIMNAPPHPWGVTDASDPAVYLSGGACGTFDVTCDCDTFEASAKLWPIETDDYVNRASDWGIACPDCAYDCAETEIPGHGYIKKELHITLTQTIPDPYILCGSGFPYACSLFGDYGGVDITLTYNPSTGFWESGCLAGNTGDYICDDCDGTPTKFNYGGMKVTWKGCFDPDNPALPQLVVQHFIDGSDCIDTVTPGCFGGASQSSCWNSGIHGELSASPVSGTTCTPTSLSFEGLDGSSNVLWTAELSE